MLYYEISILLILNYSLRVTKNRKYISEIILAVLSTWDFDVITTNIQSGVSALIQLLCDLESEGFPQSRTHIKINFALFIIMQDGNLSYYFGITTVDKVCNPLRTNFIVDEKPLFGVVSLSCLNKALRIVVFILLHTKYHCLKRNEICFNIL